MRRQGGRYGGDSGGGGGHGYGGAASQMHPHRQQQSDKSGYYREQSEGHQHQNQWRWERDGAQSELPQTAMSPTAPFTEGRGAPRSYSDRQRQDGRVPLEKQVGGDPRPQSHEEDMDIGYEDKHVQHTFESLEQRFLDDIMKLYREQTDAEDAENARHREKLNGISAQYQEQLVALRARHSSQREEFLRRESQARQEQYQQIVMEQYPSTNISPGEPHQHRAHNSDYYDPQRSEERARFSGNARDHRFEPKVPYPKGRSYDSGSRYH